MDFRGDDRGQSVQVGAILLFGILIIAMGTYQAQVVPSSNAAVEFEHTQQVEGEFIELRSSVLTAARTGNPQSTALSLGTRYPQRTFFVNPPPVTGTVSTSGDGTLRIENASVNASGNAQKFWENRSLSFNTQSIRYAPQYNEYDNPPDLVYEHSMVVAEFDQSVLARTGQTAVKNGELSLTLIDGNLSETGVGTRGIDTEVLSQNARSVNVNTSGSFELVLPTTVDNREDLAEEWDREIEAEANVTAVDNESAIRIELLNTPENVSLRLSQIGVGTDTTPTDESKGYMIRVGDGKVAPGGEFTVEVRDQYNNPVSDATVNPNSSTLDVKRTDEDGRATFSLDGSEFSGNSETVKLSINDEDEWETVNVTVSRSAGAGGGGSGGGGTGSGSVSNYSTGTTNDTFSSANGRWIGITCTDQLLLSDGQPASKPNGNNLQGNVIRLTASFNDSTGESFTIDVKLARKNDGSWNNKKVIIYDGNGNNQNAELRTAAATRIYEDGETDVLDISNYEKSPGSSFSNLLGQIRALEDDAPVVWQTSRMTGRVDVGLECDPPPTPPASEVSTVGGTTPTGGSSALQFDIQVPSGTTKTVTDINITTPGNQNSNVKSANQLKRTGNTDEVRLTVSNTNGVNQSGSLKQNIKLDGTKYTLDTNAVFSDGAVLSVDMGETDGGNVEWTYDLVDSQSKADVVVTFYFQDDTQFKAFLKVSNINS